MQHTPLYDRMLDALMRTSRYVSSCGGTRSGKTVTNLQLIYALAAADRRPTITSVVSETFPHLKRGAIRDFQTVALGDLWDERCWSKGESIYTLENGSIIEFFSADTPSKVHGPARDRLFLNEVQNINYETARQLFIRTRGLIILDYNPTHSFWAQEIIEPRADCVTVHSTYKDNNFLTAEQIREIEANRDDENWWRVYGLGETGRLEGVIYTFDQVDEMPPADGMLETYGLDFGFTNSFTAIVRCFIHRGRKEIWLEEVLYRRGMLNGDIAEELKARKIPAGVVIYADAAEPKSIAELQAAGLNVAKCEKTTEGDRHNPITNQVNELQGYKIHVTKFSVNLIREMRGYVWATTTTGERLNVPVKVNDHACDAFRYGCYTPIANPGYGQYNITFSRR